MISTADCVLALEIGGRHLAAAVVRADGTPLRLRRIATPVSTRAGVLVSALRGLVTGVAGAVPSERLAGVGVATAGPLDLVAGTVSPLAIPALQEFPIVDALRDLVPGRRIRLAGEGHCFALGEYRFGEARLGTSLLGVSISTEISAGLVIDGRLITGSTGNAGHIGHLVVDPDGLPCPCGSRGCLETVASAPAMLRWARSRGWRGADVAEVADQVADGEGTTQLREAFARAGRALGVAVGQVAPVLDVAEVAVAGAVNEVMLGEARRMVAELSGTAFVHRIRFRPARLGRDARLIGAACLAFTSPAAAKG